MSGTSLRKRAFASASVLRGEEGFTLALDGKAVRTPAGRALAVPNEALAAALAAEWNGLGDTIDPQALPLTRLVNTSLDGAATQRREIADDLMVHAQADLLCYRADSPERLVRRQREMWDPLLAWAEQTLGVVLTVTTGVVPVPQSASTLEKFESYISKLDDLPLTALHFASGITGSLVIAFALVKGRLDGEGAFAAAHVDEMWQSEQWGVDSEAQARLARRRQDLLDAARFIQLAQT